jgi:hypothetical protein
MFEFGAGAVNGVGVPRSLPENDFRQVLPDAGWETTYLGPTVYQVNLSVEAFEQMATRNPGKAEQIQPDILKFRLIQSWLPNGEAHAPFGRCTRLGWTRHQGPERW